MHWGFWRRFPAMLLGIWFAAYAAEPAGVLACPMHGGAPAAATAHHAPADSHGSHPHQCTCPGDCCCAPTVAFYRPATEAPQSPAMVVVAQVAIRAASGHAPRAAEHALPFATAPPLG